MDRVLAAGRAQLTDTLDRMRVAVACVLLLCGCHELFGLDYITPTDAAPPCEDPTPFGLQCRDLTLPITHDGFLSATMPEIAFGTRDAIRISDHEPGIFMFDTIDIADDERIAAMTLTLDPLYSRGAYACSSTNAACTICPAPAIGSWSVHWMPTTWNQAQATWTDAAAGTPWVLPGAQSIPEDRSPVVASGPPTGGSSGLLVMSISRDELLAKSPNCYRMGRSIALLVTIQGSTYVEPLEDTRCVSGLSNPAELTVTVCR